MHSLYPPDALLSEVISCDGFWAKSNLTLRPIFMSEFYHSDTQRSSLNLMLISVGNWSTEVRDVEVRGCPKTTPWRAVALQVSGWHTVAYTSPRFTFISFSRHGIKWINLNYRHTVYILYVCSWGPMIVGSLTPCSPSCCSLSCSPSCSASCTKGRGAQWW